MPTRLVYAIGLAIELVAGLRAMQYYRARPNG